MTDSDSYLSAPIEAEELIHVREAKKNLFFFLSPSHY